VGSVDGVNTEQRLDHGQDFGIQNRLFGLKMLLPLVAAYRHE
jgi:hypothetical protein